MVKKEKIINNKKTLKSETVLTDGKNYSSIKIPPNSIELRVGKIRRSESEKSTNNYSWCIHCKKNNRPLKWA